MSDANDTGRAPRGTSHSRGQHERSDANAWAVAGLAVSVLLVIAIAQPLVSEVFDWLRARASESNPPRAPLAVTAEPPPPRLQVSPPVDLDRLRADEHQVLSEYAWLDRERGTVRIPIDRAIDLVLKRGLPRPATPRIREESPPPVPQVNPPAVSASGDDSDDGNSPDAEPAPAQPADAAKTTPN